VHAAVARFEIEGFAAFRAAWSALNAHAGRRVRVSTPAAVVEGNVIGVAEQGELMLDCDGAVRLVNAGEVTLREAG
jgi:BirA family transcriptional regulator, biotin operon repressor / biotin---[acetyl-CoA-carboxylase] ligase